MRTCRCREICQAAGDYVKGMSLSDMALFKVCILSAGLLLGLAVPKKFRRAAAFLAMIAFLATYLPSILKFWKKVLASEAR